MSKEAGEDHQHVEVVVGHEAAERHMGKQP